jgi:ElaB/YqjD/DUF883 family membrane-anchored ribosome-binding protein
MFGLLVGAIGGGVAAYYWRDNIRDYMSGRVPELRAQAADALGTLGVRAGGALDKMRSGIDAAVRTGQERLRPTGTAGDERNQRMQGTEPRDASGG